MTPEPPLLDARFPTPHTAEALERWQRHRRLSVLASWLDALSFGHFAPRRQTLPRFPSVSLRHEGMAAARDCLGRPIEEERFRHAFDDIERLADALRAYEEASAARTNRLRLHALAWGTSVHIAFLGAVLLLIESGSSDWATIPVTLLWALIVLGSGLAARRWIDPILFDGSSALVGSGYREPIRKGG